MVHMSKVFFASFAVLAVAQELRQELEQAFEEFRSDFKKDYNGLESKLAHFEAFVHNYNYIRRENAKNHSYKLGLNEFSDMSQEQFAMTHLGLLRSESAWAGKVSLGLHEVGLEAPPASVDWRQKAVTPVKNQAACGSCWAFSTTGALEGAWAVATGKLVSLSEQQLVDCSKSFGNQGCSGGLMDNGFKYEETVGVCTEESYAYAAKAGICQAANCTIGLPKGAVVGYKDVPVNNEKALMDAVSKGPVSVAIEADQLSFQTYKSGVLTKACGTKLDHGVLIVGYGTEEKTDYWLVKNSWGPTWGEGGFIKIERGVPGAGECGIKSDASYPVVKAQETESIVV